METILVKKYEVWGGLNPPKCFIYKHLGGFRRLARNHKLSQERSLKAPTNDAKIELFAHKVVFFEILGGLLRAQVSERFLKTVLGEPKRQK